MRKSTPLLLVLGALMAMVAPNCSDCDTVGCASRISVDFVGLTTTASGKFELCADSTCVVVPSELVRDQTLHLVDEEGTTQTLDRPNAESVGLAPGHAVVGRDMVILAPSETSPSSVVVKGAKAVTLRLNSDNSSSTTTPCGTKCRSAELTYDAAAGAFR